MMKSIVGFKKKSVLFLLVIVVFIATILTFLFSQVNAYAQEETLEQRIERLTSSDVINIDGGISVDEFTQRVKSGNYHNPAYLYSTPHNGIITELIPEELFYTPNTYSYMGKEWGFMLHTEQQYAAWHSWLVLIDFEIANFQTENGNSRNQFVNYRMENLINMYFSTSLNSDGTHTIVAPNSYAGFDIYITDIARMQNYLMKTNQT